jgi:hypothetical protein
MPANQIVSFLSCEPTATANDTMVTYMAGQESTLCRSVPTALSSTTHHLPVLRGPETLSFSLQQLSPWQLSIIGWQLQGHTKETGIRNFRETTPISSGQLEGRHAQVSITGSSRYINQFQLSSAIYLYSYLYYVLSTYNSTQKSWAEGS